MTSNAAYRIPVWDGLEDKLSAYDLLTIDLWGVMHDGITLHHDAVDAVLNARAAGVKTCFLSNAPRPRHQVRGHLAEMGMAPELLDFVVTSGGLARDYVRDHANGARLFHLGPNGDHDTVEGLPVDLVHDPDQADVILATDLGHYDIDGHVARLRGAAERGVPFLCANPDRIVHVGDQLIPCAGAVADLYEKLGGPVHWFGKPTKEALLACVAEVGMEFKGAGNPPRAMMIGDSLQTDIAGAHAAGFDGCLIASGIHRDDLMAHISAGDEIDRDWFREHVAGDRAMPHMIMTGLRW